MEIIANSDVNSSERSSEENVVNETSTDNGINNEMQSKHVNV